MITDRIEGYVDGLPLHCIFICILPELCMGDHRPRRQKQSPRRLKAGACLLNVKAVRQLLVLGLGLLMDAMPT